MEKNRLLYVLQQIKLETDECILWPFPVHTHNGYGRVYFNGKMEIVHRVVHSLCSSFVLSSKLRVLHSCDTPRCFNPRHLFSGTQLENVRDCIKKGRRRLHRLRKIYIAKAQG